MLAYVARRFLFAILTIWVCSLLSFAIIQLPPGDPISAITSSAYEVVPKDLIDAMRTEYGLEQPLHVQYFKWIGLLLRGTGGRSILNWGQPVYAAIGERLGLTIVISLAAVLFTWLLAFPIGIYSAVKQYSLGDYFFTFVGFIGLGIPSFLLALVLMYLGFKYFGVSLAGLFSTEFADAPWSLARAWDLAKHLPLPALILAVGGSAQLIRIVRANLLDELHKPYVLTARARGLSETKLILEYPVRVALNPFISTVGYLLPYIVSGSTIVAIVMSLPTVGPLLYRGLLAQDVYLSGAIVMLLCVMTVVGTFISDLLLMWVDPRIRMEG